MSQDVLRQLSDDELRHEQLVWQTASKTSLVRDWVDLATRHHYLVVCEGRRRRQDFWKVTLS